MGFLAQCGDCGALPEFAHRSHSINASSPGISKLHGFSQCELDSMAICAALSDTRLQQFFSHNPEYELDVRKYETAYCWYGRSRQTILDEPYIIVKDMSTRQGKCSLEMEGVQLPIP